MLPGSFTVPRLTPSSSAVTMLPFPGTARGGLMATLALKVGSFSTLFQLPALKLLEAEWPWLEHEEVILWTNSCLAVAAAIMLSFLQARGRMKIQTLKLDSTLEYHTGVG
jgi:hypothetical protein